MSREKSVANVFRFLFLAKGIQVSMICAFNSLQVNAGRQKVCVNAHAELSLMLQTCSNMSETVQKLICVVRLVLILG